MANFRENVTGWGPSGAGLGASCLPIISGASAGGPCRGRATQKPPRFPGKPQRPADCVEVADFGSLTALEQALLLFLDDDAWRDHHQQALRLAADTDVFEQPVDVRHLTK